MKSIPCIRSLFAGAVAAVSLSLAPALKADPLLTASYESQLEAWLGQGNLDFTNIYSKTTGDTTFDFHAAVDGMGATFVLMNVYGNGFGYFPLPSQIIGGYNPQSWSSAETYNLTSSDADRTAFIYNLSSGALQRQNLIGEGDASSGETQTYNHHFFGPTFGYGLDLSVGYGTSIGGGFYSMDVGYARNYSYGGTSFGDEIVTGGPNFSNYSDFFVGQLEVYTIAPQVPDTGATAPMLGAVIVCLAAMRWNGRRGSS